MKKLFLLTIPVLALTLFSFVVPSSTGVTRVKENLYEIDKENKITAEDNKEILTIVKDEYGIVDFGECTSEQGIKLAAKGGSTVEWYLFIIVLIHRSTKWDNVSIANNPNLIKLDKILSQYAEAGEGGKRSN